MKHWLKKFLSYFYPQTTFADSQHSGKLEITWYNGKKMLDTKNANYSYGSLQEVLEFGIAQVDLSKVQNILILGMGAGSAIQSLRETFNYQNHITAVEWDKKIIEIAATEFGIKANQQLEIIHRNAVDFVQESTTKFDLIVVDIFIDNQIPAAIKSSALLSQLPKILNPKGYLIFNLLNLTKLEEQEIMQCLQQSIDSKIIKVPNHDNRLLIGQAF